MCKSNDDCHNHGECLSEICNCDIGWFGPSCNENLYEDSQEGFEIYRISIICAFGYLGLISLRGLYKNARESKDVSYKTDCSHIFRVFRSPVNFSMILILLISITKILWVSIDPFLLKGLMHRSIERFLSELIYSFLYALYGIVLLIWYVIYDELSYNINRKRRKLVYKYFKLGLKIRISLTFIVQINASILKGLRLGEEINYFITAEYIFGLVLFILFIIEFSLFGGQGYDLLKDVEAISLKNFRENKVQIEKYVEKINLEALNMEENQINRKSRGNKSPRSPRNKRVSIFNDNCDDNDDYENENEDEDEWAQYSLNSNNLQRIKSKSIQSFKLGQREQHPNLRKNTPFSKKKRVTYYAKPKRNESHSEANQANGKERSPSLIINSIDFDKSMDVGNPLGNLGTAMQPIKASFFKKKYANENNADDAKRNGKIKTSLNFSSENIDRDVSFMIEDPKEMFGWFVNRKERKALNEREKEKFRKFFESGNNDSFVGKSLKKKLGNGWARKSAILSEVYQQEIHDYHGKYYENNNEYLKNKEKLKKNRRIFRRILAITFSGIIFEIAFASVSIFIMSSNILENTSKIIPLYFAIGSLEFVSSYAIFKLFSNIKSREMENLRWITKVGNNKFSKHFIFKYPNYLLNYTEFPQILENRLNFLTSKAPHQVIKNFKNFKRMRTRKNMTTLRTLKTNS